MALIVQKFGGSSVADVAKMKNVAGKVIAEKERGNQVVVVVSAMGKTTDNLLSMVAEVTDDPNPRELDMLLATGEQVSISMLAIVLQSMGHKTVSMTGPQVGILTDSVHGRARIRHINTEKLKQLLDDGHIVIVAGFQGASLEGQITTLGRGGSDTTAVALAAALQADRCDIYTDVDGVYTTDPRVVPNARKLNHISYDEMLELASLGAKVLHSRSVELAKHFSVPLQVLSSFTGNPGTMIVKEYPSMEDIVVSGVAFNRNESKISLIGVPDQPGMASRLFQALGEADIPVDIIVQNVGSQGRNDITFTTGRGDFKRAREVAEAFAREHSCERVEFEENVGKISVVGIGMKSHSGVAATMFGALAKAGINIEMISTSEIKISVIIDIDHIDQAVQAIHQEFALENEPEVIG